MNMGAMYECFTKKLDIIKHHVYICKECGEKIRLNVNGSDDKKWLMKHLNTCQCKHKFSGWHDSQMGTWPDSDIMTSRTCSKCHKTEYL